MEDQGIKLTGRLCDSCGLPHTLATGVTKYRDPGNWSDCDEFGYWYFCDECLPLDNEEDNDI